MRHLYDQPSKVTNRKVRWTAAVTAITTPLSVLLALVLIDWLPELGIYIGHANLAEMLSVFVAAAVQGGVAWLTGYQVREEL